MLTIEELQAKVAEYERRMGIGTDDPTKEGYLVLVGILRQQNTFLKEFKIKDEVAKTTKEDATYGRAEAMWKGLPDMIEKVSNLKVALKMEGEEKKTTVRPLSASDIANGATL